MVGACVNYCIFFWCNVTPLYSVSNFFSLCLVHDGNAWWLLVTKFFIVFSLYGIFFIVLPVHKCSSNIFQSSFNDLCLFWVLLLICICYYFGITVLLKLWAFKCHWWLNIFACTFCDFGIFKQVYMTAC